MGIDGVIGLASNINPKNEVDLINNFNDKNHEKTLFSKYFVMNKMNF